MARVLALAGMLAVIVGVGAAPPPKADPNRKVTNKELIVGTWQRTETTQGDKSDLFLWFDEKGGMKVNRKLDGSGWGYIAKYEVKDKELPYESISPEFAHKETLTITLLNDDELAYEDPVGVKEKYKQVKDEKPKK